ncbi:MAG: oxygen-independent coproporphyrinogen III oxidase [Comamonas sp.]
MMTRATCIESPHFLSASPPLAGAAPAAARGQVPAAATLARHDVAGPRYTSYPTADRFVVAFGAADLAQALRQRRADMRVGAALARPLSLYVHIPFCDSVCYYCACNKIITRRHERADDYLGLLSAELALVTRETGRQQGVSQLHLGGGSPTFMDDRQLGDLMALLRQHFQFAPGAECAIEVDPRTVDVRRLRHLRSLGFNRLSLGVQDFDADVQRAVHRVQSTAQIFALLDEARAIGFESMNVDLIYGLPRQTPQSFARTLALIGQLRPDRLALYAYAHLPDRFKPQRRIAAQHLPDAQAKVAMLAHAQTALAAMGYVDIGMDHFALPQDSLAIAKRQGRLHRNFQGYSTLPDSDLIGLGVSAIGKVGATYSQNAKTLEGYADALGQGQLPVERGLALTRDDLVRRAVIMAIMCQGCVDFETIESAYLIDFRTAFAPEIEALAPFVREGLVQLAEGALALTPAGWAVVRAVAMVFDRYLQSDRSRARFSRIL